MTSPIANQPAGLAPATLTDILRATLASLPVDPAAATGSIAIQREAVVIAVTALRPRDPMEAMLAARIVAAHHAAMECFRRAAQPDISDSVALRLHGKAIALANLATRTLRELQKCQAGPPAYAAAEQPAGDAAQACGEPDVAPASGPAPAAAPPGIAIQDAPAGAERSWLVNDRIGPDRPYAPEPAALAA